MAFVADSCTMFVDVFVCYIDVEFIVPVCCCFVLLFLLFVYSEKDNQG